MIRITFFLLCLAITIGAAAQKPKAKLTESTVVKDTAGNVIPAAVWQQLARSASYALYPANAAQESSDFIIRRLTTAEKEAMLNKMPPPQESRFFKTGKPINAFNDKDINGNGYNLKELKGKVVVLNFWFINCPPCRMEIPELNELVKEFEGNSEVVFLGIALDGKRDLEQFLKTMPFQYNIIADAAYLAKKYNVSAFPTHVVVDRQGLVKFHTAGLARNTVHWVKKSIAESLAQPAQGSVVIKD